MLFDAGLADPRGGEYREVELRLSSGWGQIHRLTTHGWYFPRGFAVCWDGLAHPVERSGDKADLGADVASAGHHDSLLVNVGATLWREATATVPPSAELVGTALLLRLGETDLARQMLLKVPALPTSQRPVADSDRPRVDKAQWLEVAGTSWLVGGFHEAVEAHANGDDRISADIAESLLAARPKFEFARKSLSPAIGQNDVSSTAFLDPLPRLLEDSQRRLKEPPRPPLDPNAIRKLPQAERIRLLIERLEDVDERQMSQPGGVLIMGSPICKMLADEGADAIDPLLDVVERDQRLTRSFSFWRNFFPPRNLISVSDAAQAVLEAYYQVDIFRWKKDPSQRREWLVRHKYSSLAERNLDLLAEDAAEDLQWLFAARALLQESKSGVVGDELRGRSNPSVSELLAKRAAGMKSNWADDIGLLLYQWDPAAALPTLQMLAHRWWMGAQNGKIAVARLKLGDEAAAREWGEAITGAQGTVSGAIKGTQGTVEVYQLEPLWIFPSNESFKALARDLFAAPNAPLSAAGLLITGRYPGNLFRSPLLMVDAFRESVLAGLERTEEIGTVEHTPDGGLVVTMTKGFSSQGLWPDPGSHPPAGKLSMRVGDFIAWELSQIDGFPKFDLESSTEEKNTASASIAKFLRIHAGELRAPAVTLSYGPGPVVLLQR
jgi:hypothetical protein